MRKTIEMQVAVFDSLGDKYASDLRSVPKNWVQFTECKTIVFDVLDDDDVIKKQIEILDSMIEKIKKDSIAEIQEIQQKKSELLALNHLTDGE